MSDMVTVFGEKSARRDDWIEGVPVQLENDETWHFPRPIMTIRVPLDPAKDLGVISQASDTNRRFSPQFWTDQEAFRVRFGELMAGDNATHIEVARLVIPMGAGLLRRNYDLTDDEVTELLACVPGNSRNVEMYFNVAKVIMGLGPKVGAAG